MADAKENYKIGIGDLLDVKVLGETDMSTEARVSNAGFVQIPFVKEDIQAQCLTERQLASLIEEKLRKYLRHPEVSVVVKEYSGSPVSVLGAVNQPGRFQMQRQVSLLELLIMTGGLKDTAGSVAQIIHTGGTDPCDPVEAVATTAAPAAPAATGGVSGPSELVNLSKLMNGDLSENRDMRAGDIVIVPQADMVFLSGEVSRPNAFPLRERMTLTQVLALGGGPTKIAKIDDIKIVRTVPGRDRQEIAVNLKDVNKGKVPDPLLMANDVIEVPDSSGKVIRQNMMNILTGSIVSLPLRVVRGGL